MRLNFIRTMAWTVALACAIVMASCSGSDAEIQSVIPDDSRFVARVDVEAVINGLGGKIDASGVTLPDGMADKSMMGTDAADMLGAMGAIKDALDINNVYYSCSAKNLTYFVAEIKDAGKLGEIAGDRLKMQSLGSKGDYDEVYNSGYVTMLTRGNLCWLLNQGADDAVDELDKVIARAGKGAFAKVPSVADAVAGQDGLATVALLPDAKAGEWMVMSSKTAGENLEIVIESYDNQGKQVETKDATELQLDFLRYVPGDFNVAMAMGVSREYDWSRFFNLFGSSDDFKVAGFMEVLRPFLESADGTISLAAKLPVTPKVDLGEMAVTVHPFVAMIHMDQAQVNSAVENLKALLKKNFMTVTEGDGGMCRAGFGPQGALYFGNVDGYLAIGTSPFEPTAQNSLTPVFQGKTMGAMVSLSSLQGINPALKEGIDINVEGSATTTKVVVKGSDRGNALMTVFNMISLL